MKLVTIFSTDENIDIQNMQHDDLQKMEMTHDSSFLRVIGKWVAI